MARFNAKSESFLGAQIIDLPVDALVSQTREIHGTFAESVQAHRVRYATVE